MTLQKKVSTKVYSFFEGVHNLEKFIISILYLVMNSLPNTLGERSLKIRQVSDFFSPVNYFYQKKRAKLSNSLN